MTESPLRDLARKIRAMMKDHIAYSQVADFMNHIDNHLSALAFHEETCQRDNKKPDTAPPPRPEPSVPFRKG